MAISLRLSKEEDDILRAYASLNNKNISTLIRDIVFEKIEDEYDLKNFDKNFEEVKNGQWFTQEDIESELGL